MYDGEDMRVILSRKGFDSKNGGIPSPIFEDGTMMSFPIPSKLDNRDTYEQLCYMEESYKKILKDLNYDGIETCHVDPDLDQKRRKKKIDNWVPVFGQINSSARYLINIGVKEGDIFLFFGNFHNVCRMGEVYRYMRKTGDFYKDKDLQVIWGYLQVGKILSTSEEQKELWWHPHSTEERRVNPTNLIFVASETLSFDKTKPGAGLLLFDKKRVLTQENANKATWKMNKVYDPKHIEGRRKNLAQDLDKEIYYAGIWQELGLHESDECTKWARDIIL